jgi:hypothetical protein
MEWNGEGRERRKGKKGREYAWMCASEGYGDVYR